MNNSDTGTRKPLLLIIGLYLAANFLIVFNNGVFWDDWVLYNMSWEPIKTMFQGTGSPYIAYLHYGLNQFENAPMVYRILAILLQLGAIISLWKAVDLLKINRSFFFWVVVLVAVLPFFAAKNTMICFPYLIRNFFFFLASYLMIRAIQDKNMLIRGFAILSFLLSFTVNSFVVYYVMPFIILYGMVTGLSLEDAFNNWKSPQKLLKLKPLTRILDFLLLPFFFFVIKTVFLSTGGLYAKNGYNTFSLSKIVYTPINLVNSFVESFLGTGTVLLNAITTDLVFLLLFAALTIGILLLLKRNFISPQVEKKELAQYALVGLLLFFLGALPYVLVGKIPVFSGYDTRHQLLLPVGTALLATAIFFSIIKREAQLMVWSFILAACITANIHSSLQHIKGWFKQESMAVNFKNNVLIQDNNTFFVYDQSEEWDATERDYSFYNLNGILKQVDGQEDKLLVEYEEYLKHTKDGRWETWLAAAERFNMKNYVFSEPQYVIKIDNGSQALSTFSTLKLLAYKFLAKAKFEALAGNIVTINVLPYQKETSDFFLHDK